MGSRIWPSGNSGILHHYTDQLVTFEYTSNTVDKPHSILFIGDLSDGLATTSYTAEIVKALESTQWSFFTATLSSSYGQWGMGNLDRDTDEIAECIGYILKYKATKFDNSKIVLMGHSTGSQDVLHYLHRPNPHQSVHSFDPDLKHILRPTLDGAIMQAPISDREAINSVLKEGMGDRSPTDMKAIYNQIQKFTNDNAQHSNPIDIILPMAMTSQFGFGNTPISCRRWMSLASPESPLSPSEDDLFSSDLNDEQLSKTFGMIHTQGLLKSKLVVLFSGADQSVPHWVEKDRLLKRWRNATDHEGQYQIWDEKHSAVIPGASHGLSNGDQAEPLKEVVRRVTDYLHQLE